MIGRIWRRPGPRSSRPRIFLVGYYGMHNVGDEAIREAIENAAATLGVQIAHYAVRGPRESSSRAVPTGGFGLLRYLTAILTADRVVIGGGGILKDEGLRLPLELLGTALVARLLLKPVALVGVGVGPIYTRPGRWLIATIARLAQVRTVRDAASLRVLEDLGVGHVLLGADPTYASKVMALHHPPSTQPLRTPRVVVSIRPWFGKEAERERRQEGLRDAVADGVASLAAAGWETRLISLYWPRDHAEARAIAADPRVASADVRDTELDWAELLAEIEAADLVIAMRYHAVIAASLVRRPTIALAYEPKVASLAAELGIPMVAVDQPRTAEQLRAIIRAFLDGRSGCLPDEEAIDALRTRSRFALDQALTRSAEATQRGD